MTPWQRFIEQVRIVFHKELLDALRDRRTLLRMLMPMFLIGPLSLVAMSSFVQEMESRAERREVLVDGIAFAPTLRNYLERQTITLKPAPDDYEAALRAGRLGDAVLKVDEHFERDLAAGDAPTLHIVTDSANPRAQASTGQLHRLVGGFKQERATLQLLLRGVSTELLQPVVLSEDDLASPQAHSTRLTAGIVPTMIILAVLIGALNTALDTAAGERERGSLEPLLMNPAHHLALVLGKWLTVVLLAMIVAVLANASFIAAQQLIRSDSLRAIFQFGPAEAMVFVALQLPLAAAISALLLAVSIRSRSFKEAQASSTLVTLAVTLTPLVSAFNPQGDAPWYFWVPGLAQNTLMALTLKGEALGWERLAPSVLTCGVLTVAALGYVVRYLRGSVGR